MELLEEYIIGGRLWGFQSLRACPVCSLATCACGLRYKLAASHSNVMPFLSLETLNSKHLWTSPFRTHDISNILLIFCETSLWILFFNTILQHFVWESIKGTPGKDYQYCIKRNVPLIFFFEEINKVSR